MLDKLSALTGIEIPKAYTVNVNIDNYSNSDETDVVKKVEVTVTYKIGKKQLFPTVVFQNFSAITNTLPLRLFSR